MPVASLPWGPLAANLGISLTGVNELPNIVAELRSSHVVGGAVAAPVAADGVLRRVPARPRRPRGDERGDRRAGPRRRLRARRPLHALPDGAARPAAPRAARTEGLPRAHAALPRGAPRRRRARVAHRSGARRVGRHLDAAVVQPARLLAAATPRAAVPAEIGTASCRRRA